LRRKRGKTSLLEPDQIVDIAERTRISVIPR
jgi:hypothetical protein